MSELIDIFFGSFELKIQDKMFQWTRDQVTAVNSLLNSVRKLSINFQ